MEIYYTNKEIFWCNGGNDFLEKTKFEEYLPSSEWTKLPSTKSLNWTEHYSAEYYASKAFEATYFKIVVPISETKNDTFYFFVDAINNDTANGRFYSLSMDIYNSYSIHIIEKFKEENPLVLFKRKHANRFTKTGVDKRYIDLQKQYYYFNIPDYLLSYENSTLPVKKQNINAKVFDTGEVNELFPKSTKPNMRPEKLKYNKDEYYDTAHGCYWYLKVKRPLAMTLLKDVAKNYSPFFYYPIRFNSTTGDNSWDDATKWPADYVVDLISTSVSPSSFVYGSQVKLVYNIPLSEQVTFFETSTSIILTPSFFNYDEINIPSINPLGDLDDLYFNDEYNIDNYKNELMLYVAPFFKIRINDKIPLATQYLIQGEVFKDNYIKLYRRIGSDIAYYLVYDENSSYPISPYNYDSNKYCFSDMMQHPFASSVLNQYINHNVNAWNTSISLAKQQQVIDTGLAVANGVFGDFMGGTTLHFGNRLMDYGLEMMNQSTMTFGPGLVSAYHSFPKNYYLHGFNTWAQGMYSNISGRQQRGNSLITMIGSIVQSKFNTKAAIKNVRASVRDASNKPPEVSDTFSLSTHSLFNGSSLFVTYEELPESTKKVIFEDFYFNGYIVNNVEEFNTYDNRLAFNYFEITNVFQLASKWFKYPKEILVNACSVIEDGLRLWKTPSFDYTMKTNNQEKSYA